MAIPGIARQQCNPATTCQWRRYSFNRQFLKIDGELYLRKAEKDFGRPIEPRLNVRVDRLTLVAGRAKIDNLDYWTLKAAQDQRKYERQWRKAHFLSKMFSGFRSQWISLALFSKLRPLSNCCANTLTSVVLRPRNWFCLISS